MNRIERISILLALLLLSIFLLWPTFKFNVLTSAEDRKVAVESNAFIRQKAATEINSLYNAIQSEPDSIDLSSKYKQVVSAANEVNFSKSGDVWDKTQLLAAIDFGAREVLEKQRRNYYLSLKKTAGKSLKFGLDLRGGLSVLLEADVDKTKERLGVENISSADLSSMLKDDVELLRRRMDEFGLSEVDVHTQGSDQIVIEMPGSGDTERINSIISNSGSLKFTIVDTDRTNSLYSDVITNRSKYINDKGDFIPQTISEGYTAAGFYKSDDMGMDVLAGYYVLDDRQTVDASYIKSVETSRDPQTNQPVVNFTLSNEGGDKFYELTSRNVNRLLAVVLNGKIKNVATIRQALSTNIQVSGFNLQEAEELTITLKSSTLPLDLKLISSQVVGSSLGEDAVSQTKLAVIIGLCILSVFMIAYYQLPGLMAVILLALNMFFIVAALSSFGLTLSLTSISGIILTIGMAADSSIIIFERIKEEQRRGIPSYDCVKRAYRAATWTILDANITTLIAAIVLSFLGTTSVKGFAITLIIGIISTLITMLFASHLMFDLFVTPSSNKKIFKLISKKENKELKGATNG